MRQVELYHLTPAKNEAVAGIDHATVHGKIVKQRATQLALEGHSDLHIDHFAFGDSFVHSTP